MVSGLLVAGSLGEGGLGGYTSGEDFDLVVEGFFVLLESGEVSGDSFLLLVEGLEGNVVLFLVGLPCVFEVGSQGLQHLDESLDGGLVSTFLGDLGEGSEDGLISLDLSELDGVLN